jgi:hypothetical protein
VPGSRKRRSPDAKASSDSASATLTVDPGATGCQSYEAVIYEAARYPISAPVMRTVRIEDLPKAPVSGISTLVALPRELVTADMAMVNRLGIPDDYVVKKSEPSAPAIPRAAQDPPT